MPVAATRIRDGRPPLISVITPVRNGERHLATAIGSVREQTLGAWEYLIVDGASGDRSRAIAEEHAARDPRIRVLSEPDHGMYDALLKGLERTSAPICCWINADDRFMPWAFELVVRYMRLTELPWVSGLPACMDAAGLVHTIDGVRWYPRPLLRAGLFHERALGFVQQEGTFFRRELLDALDPAARARIRASRQAGDTFLWRSFARHAPLDVLPTVLGVFRRHDANMTADMGAYLEELRAAGYPMPPRLVVALMKALFVPAAGLHQRRRLRRWRALWPALLAGRVEEPETTPAAAPAEVSAP